jgi:hypothetical protein
MVYRILDDFVVASAVFADIPSSRVGTIGAYGHRKNQKHRFAHD